MERLKRFSPPGMGTQGVRFWTLGTIVVSALFSMMFLLEYFEALNELKRNMEYPAYSGMTMPFFEDLIHSPMALFRLAPVVPLVYTASNYLYFYQESRSDYTMRRLKSPWEMHIRCLTLPILGAVLVIAAALAVYGCYWLLYRYFTPEILLPVSL